MRDEGPPLPSSVRDPFAPPSKPAPPPEKRRRDWSRWRRPALVAGGVVVVMGAGYAGARAWLGGAGPLPMPASELPASVNRVEKRVVRSKSASGPEVMISRYAAACGGPDVVSFARHGQDFYGPEALAEILADQAETRRALQCGEAITKHVAGGVAYTLDLDEPSGGSVELLDLGADAPFEEGARAHPPAGLSVMWCASGKGAASCGAAPAIARVATSGRWVLGVGKDVEAFGAASAGGSKLEARDAVAFTNLARAVRGYDMTELGNAKARFYFEPFDLLDDASHEVEAATHAFEAKLADLGAHWATGGPFDEEGEMRLEIALASPGEAKDVLEALKDVRLAIRHGGDPVARGASSAERAYWAAYTAMERRALVDAEPALDDATIHLVLRLVAKKEERQAITAGLEAFGERNERAAHLVRALVEGKAPSDDDLRAIGGADLWRALDRKGAETAATERRDAPPPVEVPGAAGVEAPGGGKSEGEGRAFAYRVSSEDAVAIVNEAKHLLVKAGWTVTPTRYGALGPEYRATQDDRALALRATWAPGELRLELRAE